MTRTQALEAVAKKAAAFHQAMLAPIGRMPEGYLSRAQDELEEAFSALNALPADPAPAEVVEAAVWEDADEYFLSVRAGSKLDQRFRSTPGWARLGTVRLPLVKGDEA